MFRIDWPRLLSRNKQWGASQLIRLLLFITFYSWNVKLLHFILCIKRKLTRLECLKVFQHFQVSVNGDISTLGDMYFFFKLSFFIFLNFLDIDESSFPPSPVCHVSCVLWCGWAWMWTSLPFFHCGLTSHLLPVWWRHLSGWPTQWRKKHCLVEFTLEHLTKHNFYFFLWHITGERGHCWGPNRCIIV